MADRDVSVSARDVSEAVAQWVFALETGVDCVILVLLICALRKRGSH